MHPSKLLPILTLLTAHHTTAQSAIQCSTYCQSYEFDLAQSNAVATWVNNIPINVKAPGSAMSPAILEYMCTDGFTLACILPPCEGSYLATNKDKWNLLLSWATVCNTRAKSGDSYAISCWESKIAEDCDYIPAPA